MAYASHALSRPERNYSITELETLAVVWAIDHFRHCLYGRAVTVYTKHSAVKAVLETPNPIGKHTWWWNKVFGSSIFKVQIVYHSGKENDNPLQMPALATLSAPDHLIQKYLLTSWLSRLMIYQHSSAKTPTHPHGSPSPSGITSNRIHGFIT